MTRVVLLLTLLAISWESCCSLCPLNCSCPVLELTDCSGLKLSEVPNIDGSAEIIDLSRNSLTEFSFLQQLNNLRFINLSRNLLTEAHFGFLPNLTVADLSHNNISHLTKILFYNSPNLQVLNLTGNRKLHELKSYPQPSESVFSSLEILDVSSCGVKNIHSSFLEHFPRLKVFNVFNNSIKAWKDLKSASLVHLNVGTNKITQFSSLGLRNFPKLKSLDVSNNDDLRITFTGECLPLESADFSSSSLSHISVESLCHLEKISFAFNSIEAIITSTFSKNNMLKYLNVSFNNIERIDRHAFFNNSLIKKLDLSNNDLKEISWTSYLTDVQIFNLSWNKIETIEGLKLPNVTVLDLAQNEIAVFEIKIQSSLPKIEYLDVRHNIIEYIPPLCSTSLKVLKLGYCQISILDKNAFQGLKILRFLDLEGNKIKRLNFQTLSLVPTLLDVQLGHNPWSCDCKNPQFRNLYNYLLINKTIELRPNDLRCDEVKMSWFEACPPPAKSLGENHILMIVAAFFVLALLGMGVLIYCKSKQMRARMALDGNRVIHHDNEDSRSRVSSEQQPFRRAHSDADVYSAGRTSQIHQQLSVPPPSYEEALLLPPLSETERMTRSMGVLLDRIT